MTVAELIDNLHFVEEEKEYLKGAYENELELDVESEEGEEVVEWLKETCQEMVEGWFEWKNL